MTLGNDEIARLVEMGARSEEVYKTVIAKESGEEVAVEFKWRPLKEHEYNMSVSNAFDHIPGSAVKWLIAKKEDREKMKEDGVKVPNSHIRVFDHWLDVNVVYHAMADFYPETTVEQVSKLAINFREFGDMVSKGSGNKDGQETVNSFPADEPKPKSKGKTA